MSQDLFAAFTSNDRGSAGDFETHTVAASPWSQHTSLVDAQSNDDDFGDFEDASAGTAKQPAPGLSAPVYDSNKGPAVRLERTAEKKSTPPYQSAGGTKTSHPNSSHGPVTGAISTTGRHPFANHMDLLFAADEDEYDAGQDEWNDLSNNPEAAMAYSKRVIQEQMEAEARRFAPRPTAQVHESKPASVKMKDPNVLFDAEDLSDHEEQDIDNTDDWGDFEQSNVEPMKHTGSIDTHNVPSSMDLLGLDEPAPQLLQRAPTPTAVPKSQVNISSSAMKPPANIPDDSWDDFDVEDQPMTASATAAQSNGAMLPTSPPTNVPPPSVLLSHIAMLLKVAPSQKNVSVLLETAWILAHVLAGRKLRWKRSPLLAASMRIGPAAAGGKSGMKLAGIDRAEIGKEDREVAEVLTIWGAQVGRLRTVVSSYALAKNFPAAIRRLPDISQTMPVKSLKAAAGGFTASHECALCGLKREERIAKLDDDVQDSFGEWWIDNASMHATCAQWWAGNETALRSR